MLNIPLILTKEISCLESQIISLMDWKKLNYELAFSELWGFSFKKEDPQYPGAFGPRISANTGMMIKSLSNYYNVKLKTYKNLSAHKVYKIIQENLSKEMPVIIMTNLFYCPWSQLYQKGYNSNQHVCMVTGLDTEGNPHCIDAAPKCDGSIMKLQDFYDGCNGCITIDLNHYRINPIKLKKILNKLILHLYRNSTFKAIKNFSNDFITNFNIDAEIETSKHSPINSTIFWQIERISGGRSLFGLTLKFLGEKNGINELISLSDDFLDLSKKWYIIRSLIMKNLYNRDDKKVIYRINEILSSLSESEEKIAKNIKKIIQRIK